jgi:integrase
MANKQVPTLPCGGTGDLAFDRALLVSDCTTFPMRTLRLRVRGHRSSYRARHHCVRTTAGVPAQPIKRKDTCRRDATVSALLEIQMPHYLPLDKAVSAVVGWALSSLPKHLAAEQVEKVLDHCDRATKAGRRDYAILLLLAREGCAREKSSR